MENEKVLHTRMRQKRATKSAWDAVKDSFAPLDGELIIYKDGLNGGKSTPTIFVGDGETKLSSLKPIGTYNHNESELSWDNEVIVGHVGADAITVSLPKPTFVAESIEFYNGQPGVALKFTAGNTPQTINIYNPSNTSGIQYDSTSRTISIDAPPTSHASSSTTYGEATDTIYGHVTLQRAENCSTYTSDNTALTPAAVNKAITSNIFRATDSHYGVVKTGYETDGPHRKYAVRLDYQDKMFVHVPWTDTTYSAATSTTLGLVKTGYETQSNRGYYAVALNDSNQMYVDLPGASRDVYGVVKMSSSNGTLSITT